MAARYLKYFPDPLLDDLVKGRVLQIVGAGLSLNAVVPRAKRMPLWSDLGVALERDLGEYSSHGAIDSISAYEHEFGRARLIERLTELLLITDAQPGEAHKAFCNIPFGLVCTTNFDFLLERQYELIPRYVYPVVDEDQLAINVPSDGMQLLKLHGDLRHPNRMVVSEADYDGFLSHYPLLATYLSNQLITKSALLVGYSLEDPDFRQIWHVVTDRLGRNRRKAYSIGVAVKTADVTRFERRGVKVINLPGAKERYGEILAEAFRELREHIRNNLISVSKVTEERPLQELLLPRTSATRLCFFSMPLELLSFYRERVFPAVAAAGYVPVTADEVVSPGDSVVAKIDALIDRAAVMVIELNSSQWSRTELNMALARLKAEGATGDEREFYLFIVVTDDEQIPPIAQNFQVIRRQHLHSDDADSFIADLVQRLTIIAGDSDAERHTEPERLLRAKEYRAATIAAMALLETTLREAIAVKPTRLIAADSGRRPMSFRALVDIAMQLELIDNDQYQQIRIWQNLRNAVVHSSQPMSRLSATELVHGVLAVVATLTSAREAVRASSADGSPPTKCET